MKGYTVKAHPMVRQGERGELGTGVELVIDSDVLCEGQSLPRGEPGDIVHVGLWSVWSRGGGAGGRGLWSVWSRGAGEGLWSVWSRGAGGGGYGACGAGGRGRGYGACGAGGGGYGACYGACGAGGGGRGEGVAAGTQRQPAHIRISNGLLLGIW